jgi:hypothetical protein
MEKCLARGCMPAFLPMTSRLWLCRTGRCGSMQRSWTVALQVREENSVAVRRKAREKLLEAARGEVKPPMFAAVGRREAPPCHYVQTW